MHALIKFTVGLLIGLLLAHSAFAGAAADAFARKDYNEAYRQWSKTPDTLEAKYGIGRILLEGLGGPKDTDKGLANIKEAASGGYRPALEYLADFFERSGAYNTAISYLRRLQETSKTLKRQEEIVRMLAAMTRKPHSKNKDYCQELKTLSELGGSGDKTTTRECALNGLPSAMTKAQAESELKATLVTSPSFNSLERLAPVALNPESDGFDPASVLDALLKVDPTLSTSESKRLADLGAVSRDICVSLPASNARQKINQLSYCALAALKGDRQLSITSAKAFASGELGRKSVDLALTFARLAGSPPELNGLQLRMLAESPNKWKDHLDFLTASVQTLSGADLIEAVRFQSSLASKPIRGYTRNEYAQLLSIAVSAKNNIDLEELEKLLNARDALPAPTSFAALGGEPKNLESDYETLKKRFSGEPGVRYKLRKVRASGDVRTFLPLVNELIALNPTLDQSERANLLEDSLNMADSRGVALDATSAITLGNLFLSLSFEGTKETEQKGYRTAAIVRQKLEQARELDVRKSPESTTELNAVIQKITNYIVSPESKLAELAPSQGQGSTVFSTKPTPQANESMSVLDERKIVCNRTNLPDICREVGLTLTKQLQVERFGLKATDLLNEALSYLGKAVAAGDLVAHRYIVDAYDAKQLSTEEDRKQSNRSLEALLARGDIGGELRRHLKTINTNPLSQVLTNLGSIFRGGNQFADACSKVKAIVDSNRLDDYDMGLAAAALDSTTCKPRVTQ